MRFLLVLFGVALLATQVMADGIGWPGQGGIGYGFDGTIGKYSGVTGGSPAAYLGQVATRTYVPDDVNTTNKQMRGRSCHIARDTIVNPTLIFPNFYVDSFAAGATYAELGVGAASTITASIEYPYGTFSQVTFSGSSSGTIPNISTLAGTATITITKDTLFCTRYYITNTGGVVFGLGVPNGTTTYPAPAGNVPGNYQYGDVLEAAVSGLTDNTMGGAYTTTSGSNRYSPIIIAAQTSLPSVLVIGDSKAYGEDDAGDAAGDVGETQRWLHPFFATANWGIRGQDAGQFVANCTIRCSFNSYFTHLVNEDGINGFIHGESAATVATNTTALGNKFPTLTKYIVTILPSSTTTDNYATTTNQTLPSYSAGVATENARRRAVPSPFVGVFDSAAALESSPGSGLVATQSPSGALLYYTQAASSVHPVWGGYIRVAEYNRVSAASTINRGSSVSFSPRLFVYEADHAEDSTSQSTYTFSGRNFLIGTASPYRLVAALCVSRFGTTGATSTSMTIGGVTATKVNEATNTTGGAETLQTAWIAAVPTGNTATLSAVYSTTMLRAGCNVWTVTGYNELPTVANSSNNSGATTVAASAVTIPTNGAAIVSTSVVNGTAPTMTPSPTGFVVGILGGGTVVGGTLYYTAGAMEQPLGAQTLTSTWNGGTVATQVAVAFQP